MSDADSQSGDVKREQDISEPPTEDCDQHGDETAHEATSTESNHAGALAQAVADYTERLQDSFELYLRQATEDGVLQMRPDNRPYSVRVGRTAAGDLTMHVDGVINPNFFDSLSESTKESLRLLRNLPLDTFLDTSSDPADNTFLEELTPIIDVLVVMELFEEYNSVVWALPQHPPLVILFPDVEKHLEEVLDT